MYNYVVTSALIVSFKKAQRQRAYKIDGEPQELRYYWSSVDELSVKDELNLMH